MKIRLQNLHILFFLIFLQSCSGGKIGNFLESSFKNIEQNENLKNKKKIIEQKNSLVDVKKSNNNLISKKNKDEFNNPSNLNNNSKRSIKAKQENNKLNNLNSDKNMIQIEKKDLIKKDFQNLVNTKNKKYTPQAYKIIIILKNVDPTAPAEEFSNVLRNSNINFEIEKIERDYNSDDK